MVAYKQPTFQERAELAAKAKQAALEKLRSKPPVDEAVLAEKRAAHLAQEEAKAKASEEKRQAREREREARKANAPAAAAAQTEEEKKAARDARYAARKNRSGRK
jgi:hypothetical protein